MDTNLTTLELPNFQLPTDASESEALPIQDPGKFLLDQIEKSLRDENKKALLTIYDQEFNKLADRLSLPHPSHFKDSVPQQILCLYAELYFRHLYSKSSVTPIHRIQSFKNYKTLFSLALNELQFAKLPAQWVWDMLDEFVYQFQSFWQNYSKYAEEVKNANVWSLENVSEILGNIQSSSRVLSAGKLSCPSSQFLSLLGFFSSVAMIRLHCQQGNYEAALDDARCIDSQGVKCLANYPAAYLSMQYYVGFSAMMLGRTYDAGKCFGDGLSYLYKIKQYLTRSYQYNILMKKADQILLLLCAVNTLTPLQLDSQLCNLIQDKFKDKHHRMKIGNFTAFEEIFSYSAPKTIDAKSGNFVNLAAEQVSKFMDLVSGYIPIIQISSYMDSYLPGTLISISTIDSITGHSTQSALEKWKNQSVQVTFQAGFSQKTSPRFISTREISLQNGSVTLIRKDPSEKLAEFFWQETKKLHEIRSSL